MTPTMALFTYINCWFITLFFVFPFYIKSASSQRITDYKASPEEMNWMSLLKVNSLISFAITAGLVWLIESGLFSMKDF